MLSTPPYVTQKVVFGAGTLNHDVNTGLVGRGLGSLG